MKFIPLEDEAQLQEIKQSKGSQVIFKHNTTCPISKGVWKDLEQGVDELSGAGNLYYLDLLQHRDISNAIADEFGVEHQSPQILLIQDGKCTYHEWGYDITAKETAAHMGQ